MEQSNKVSIHVDYMSFTFPIETESVDIIDAFYEIRDELAEVLYCTSDMFAEERFTQNGYKYQFTLGENITIRFGGQTTKMKKVIDLDNNIKSETMYDSLNVELKGQACREIERYANFEVDYIKLIRYFIEEKSGRCKRFDIAIDDVAGDVISMETVYNTLQKGHYTSCFRRKPIQNGEFTKTVDFKDKSLSIYFGKAGGHHKPGLELCIYNKKAEREFNNDSYAGDYWVRYEIRYRDDKADELAYYFLKNNMDNIGEFACGQLKFILELKQMKRNSKDSHVERWPVHLAWEKFLDCVKGSRLSQRSPALSTIIKKMNWRDFSLTRQNILLGMVEAYSHKDKVNNYIDPLISEAVYNLSEQYNYLLTHVISGAELQMMNNYLKEIGAGYSLTKDDIYAYMEDIQNRIDRFVNDFTLPF